LPREKEEGIGGLRRKSFAVHRCGVQKLTVAEPDARSNGHSCTAGEHHGVFEELCFRFGIAFPLWPWLTLIVRQNSMSTEFAKHIAILEAASQNKLPDTYQAATGGDMETFYELYRADMVACTNPNQITGVADFDAFCFPRITVAGREALEKWKKEQRESTIGWQLVHILQKATLWIGLALGVAMTKLIEIGVERLMSRTP